MDLIDVTTLSPGFGQIWQGSEWTAFFNDVPKPRMIFSLIGETEPFTSGSLCHFLLDNDIAVLPDTTLIATVQSAIAFLRSGHNILVHCFEGKYRSTYIDVAIHMGMGMVFADAFALVRKRHTIADLRAGTRAQLTRLEHRLNSLA